VISNWHIITAVVITIILSSLVVLQMVYSMLVYITTTKKVITDIAAQTETDSNSDYSETDEQTTAQNDTQTAHATASTTDIAIQTDVEVCNNHDAIEVQEPTTEHESTAVTYMDVLDAMQNAIWLPRSANSITTSSCALVRASRRSVNLIIADTITADTVRSIMQHSNIVRLDMKCAELAGPVLQALPDIFTQQLALNSNLTSLTLDDFQSLNQNVVNSLFKSLPSSMHTMSITQAAAHRHNNQHYDAVTCPLSVKHLTLTHCAFTVVKPEGLLTLHMDCCDPKAYDDLPSTLLELHAKNAVFSLPPLPHGLQKLQMHSTTDWRRDVVIGDIPDTVTHLKLPEFHRLRIEQWPTELLVLDVGNHYPHDLNELPPTVTELYVKIDRNASAVNYITSLPRDLRVYEIATLQSRVETLPEGLEVLRMDCSSVQVGQIMPTQLPDTLKELKVSGYDYRELPLLPEGLEILNLGWAYRFQQELNDSMLPVALKTLCVSEVYKHSLEHLRSSITVQRMGPRYSIIDRRIW
jgi:hypothetical protein